ncbi:hypothetical protein E2C01_070889 [Portunus trituberculatus]|uniref:Uncharacterized protein n=1 Tax=Portunus trituberculatus TaxID=210409 RepID=A0A5B7I3F4_PORTR|nr:hypothetical protein [Portunus trituberculatus]
MLFTCFFSDKLSLIVIPRGHNHFLWKSTYNFAPF